MESNMVPNQDIIKDLLTYEDGVDLIMDDLKLPINGINNLNDVKEFLTCKYVNEYSDCTDVDQDFKKYLEDFEIVRASLIKLEEKIINFMESDLFKQELEQDLKDDLKSDSYLLKLETYRNNLRNYECPIMVIGESKAGKSSFINLFLGDIVLPVDNLTCTKILCHLKYGEKKKVVFSQSKLYEETFGKSKKHEDIEIKLDVLTELKQRELYGRISMNKGQNQFYDEAFFHWPLGFLKEHTVMVDSPGLCDSDELNEKTLECFDKKAAAYIFVFNATRENRWVDDFVREAYKKLSSLDLMTKETEKVIFVINQWDLITDFHPDEEEEKQNSVLDKLKQLWPGLDTEDKVFFISSKKTLDWLKQKAVPESFIRLNNSLQKLIRKAHKSTTDSNYGLIKKILEKVDRLVREKIKLTHDRHFNQRNFEHETRVLISKLKETREMAAQVAKELLKETEINFFDAAKNFLLYLQSEEIMSELLDLNKVTLHSYNSIHIITPLIKKIIRQRMERAIISWDKDTKFLSNLYELFNHSLKCKLNSLGDALTAIDTGLKRDFMDFSNEDKDTEILNQGGMEVISPFEKAVLITSSFVLFPVMAIGAMVAAPNFIVSLVKDKFDEKALLDEFKSNPYTYAQNKFQTYLEELTPKDIIETFFGHMLNQFGLAAHSIPERIDSLILMERRKLKGFLEESRSTDQLLKVYLPLQMVSNCLSGELYLIEFNHHSDDQYEYDDKIDYPLPEGDCILETIFAKYYRIPRSNHLVYRVLKQAFTENSAKEQYEELKIFKSSLKFIHHRENILEMKSYKRIYKPPVLIYIMESFDMSLREYLEKYPDYIPVKHKDLEKKKKAFDLCLEIAGQTAQVLFNVNVTYGLVHRDLRTENVLIKVDEENKVTIKLCDFANLKQLDATVKNNPQAFQFLPPEMKYQLGAFDKAEVYCFGAFLWEIYTMGDVPADENTLGDSLSDTQTPGFSLNDPLAPRAWKKLIDNCLDLNPIRRPKMETCFETIKQLKKELDQPSWREMFQECHEKKVMILEKDFKRTLSLE